MRDRDSSVRQQRLPQAIGFTMSEDEIVAALSVLTWNTRPEQTFAASLQRDTESLRRAHVRDVGKLYRAMLRDATEQKTINGAGPPPPVGRSAARDRDAQVSRI